MTEINFLDIISVVCKHPRVYTKNGSFEEAVIFLEGYALGANVGNNDFHSKFTPFLQWAAKKFGVNDSRMNWDEFRKMFVNEIESFNNLISLYKDYIASLKQQ